MILVSLAAIILGLVFIIVRAFKGHPPFMSCLIAVVFISVLSGLSVPDSIATAFATGTANMLRSMLLFFCACTLFGKVMEESGYAHSIAYFISDHVKATWAPTIIFLTPFYQQLLAWVSESTISLYVLCWGGGSLMAGIIGSSTSAISTLVPNIMPLLENYASNGYNMGVMHRLICVGSVSLDSLPHNRPVVAALNGYALGGGAELSLCCDF